MTIDEFVAFTNIKFKKKREIFDVHYELTSYLMKEGNLLLPCSFELHSDRGTPANLVDHIGGYQV